MLQRGVMYTLVTIVQAAALIVATPVLTRSLGQLEFGRLATGIAVAQLLVVVLPLGLSLSLSFAVYDRLHGVSEDALNPLIGSAVAVTLSLAGLVGATAVLWGPAVGVASGPALLIVAWAAGAGMLGLVQAVLRAENRTRSFAALTLLAVAGGPLVGTLAVVATKYRTGAYLGSMAVA